MGHGQFGHLHYYTLPVRATPPLKTNRTWTEGYMGKDNLAAGHTGATRKIRGIELTST